jgi:hypothetical protein
MPSPRSMLTDPRIFPDGRDAPAELARCYALASASLGAATGAESQSLDEQLADRLREWLDRDEGARLAALLSGAPSVDVHRHLVRLLARAAEPDPDGGLAITIFSIPVVLVAASSAPAGANARLQGVLPDAAAISAALRDHGALAGNRTIAIANALTGTAAFDVAALPGLVRAAHLPTDADGIVPLALPPSPLEIAGASEGAHLRFLVGTAVAAPGAGLLRDTGVGRWGMPLARELSAQLKARDATLLALPRAAQSPVTAVQAGRAAQREVSAQLFASNALRKLRAAFGEPTAVISAHRVADGRGEVRLSLSTPFDPREAEGFRAPLHAFDRVGDVASMLVDLMRDCRIADIRIVDGVHADRDSDTGLAVLFKPATIPPGAPVTLH